MPHPYRKILGLNSPGDEDHMAGDDFDILTQWFEDIDLSATYPARVATNTEFRDNRLRILNPLRTNSISIRTLGFTEDLNLTIPYMEADDDLMLLASNQEVYNKTISIIDNELINATGTAGDMLVFDGDKYIPFSLGLPSQHLTVSEDGLGLVWVDLETMIAPPPPPPGVPPPPPSSMIPDDNSVTTAKIVDAAVTNSKLASNAVTSIKITDGSIIATKIPDLSITNVKLAGGIEGGKLNNGTIKTLQIADLNITTVKLAGSISDDKLLPITDTTKLPSSIRYDWSVVRPAAYTMTTATGGEGVWSGVLASVGTHTNHSTTSTVYRAKFTTSTTINTQAGVRTSVPYIKPTTFLDNYAFECKFSWPASTNVHAFIGLTSDTTNFPPSGIDMLNAKSGIGMYLNSANTNLKCARNDGVGATVQTEDLSPAVTIAGGGLHTIKIYYDKSLLQFNIQLDGTNNFYTTDIPSVNQSLGMIAYVETRDTVTKELEIARLFHPTMPR